MTRYTPADSVAWLVLVGDRRVLAVEPSPAGRTRDLETLLAAPDGFAGALEEIARNGILTAPGFALLDWSEGALRAVLRGAARMTVVATVGEVTSSGGGVATWVEQMIEDPRSVRLEIPGGVIDATTVAPATAAPDSEATIVSSELPSDSSAAVASMTASVPSAPPGPAGAPGDAPVAAESTADASDDDLLVEATVIRTVAGAAVRLPSGDAERLGDRDGDTVIAGDIRGLGGRPLPAAEGRRESGDHHPHPRSPTFSLVSSTGEAEPLDRGAIIGRAPSVSQVSGTSIPRLVTIADDPDISRNHVRVAIEGDAPIVTDLGSKNGTSIVQPGKPPQRLRGNEPTIVLPGTVIDLGAGTEFTIRQDALERGVE